MSELEKCKTAIQQMREALEHEHDGTCSIKDDGSDQCDLCDALSFPPPDLDAVVAEAKAQGRSEEAEAMNHRLDMVKSIAKKHLTAQRFNDFFDEFQRNEYAALRDGKIKS